MYNYTKQTHNWMAAAAAESIEWGSSRSSIESPSLVLLVGFCVALWQRGVLARFPHLPSLAHPLIHHRLSLLIQSQFRRAQPLALSLSTLYSPWRVPAHGRTGRREVVADRRRSHRRRRCRRILSDRVERRSIFSPLLLFFLLAHRKSKTHQSQLRMRESTVRGRRGRTESSSGAPKNRKKKKSRRCHRLVTELSYPDAGRRVAWLGGERQTGAVWQRWSNLNLFFIHPSIPPLHSLLHRI